MPRPKMGYRTASKACYLKFKEEHPEHNITFVQYVKIIRAWNEMFMLTIIESGDELKLPYGLGMLTIGKHKPKKKRITKEGKEIINLPIDWKSTKEAGKFVYYMNFHTDGYKYHWHWDYKTSYLKQAFAWKFEVSRHFGRLLSSLLMGGGDYKNRYKDFSR